MAASGHEDGDAGLGRRDGMSSGTLFGSRQAERGPLRVLPWSIAGGVILLIALALALGGHRRSPANALLPLDAMAGSVVFSGVTLSESVSLAGGKSIYVDGLVRNNGSSTIKAVTLQALFANDEALPPQVETLPLALIRTREPYVDTQPVSASPLRPGSEREFRLIFEGITPNWNQRAPEIRVVRVSSE